MEPGDPDDENTQRRSFDPPPPEPPKSILSRVLWGSVWTVAALLTVVVVLRVVWHDGLWILWFANALTPYLFVPAYVVLILGILSRRWGLNFLALALVCFHVASIGPQVLRRTQHSAGEAELKLITATLGPVPNERQALLREIEVHTPDLLFLQEVDAAWSETLEADGWNETYPYSVRSAEDGMAATALLSKHPLQGARTLAFGGSPQVSALIELDHGPVELLNVRLPEPTYDSFRTHQVAVSELTQWVRTREHSFVVAGNFFSTPFSAASAALEPYLDDAWNTTVGGLGGTWPNGQFGFCPFRIDRVLISLDMTSPEMILGEGPGSSHRLLMARVAFRE